MRDRTLISFNAYQCVTDGRMDGQTDKYAIYTHIDRDKNQCLDGVLLLIVFTRNQIFLKWAKMRQKKSNVILWNPLAILQTNKCN